MNMRDAVMDWDARAHRPVMRPSATALAKLSRPHLYGALPRERLFRLIEQYRAHPLIWAGGPPGAGKTTLVASYLESQSLSGIWYRIDGGDADPASFFHHLGLAAAQVSATGKPLPHLRAEYLPDLASFSRRFFRDLYAQLPHPAIVVFDDCQQVPLDSAFHGIVSDTAQEIPDGVNVVVLSRGEPPAAYSRLLANRTMALLDWNDLRLTRDETRAIAASVSKDNVVLDTVYRQSDGWAAGLTLMLERLRRDGSIGERLDARMREATFDYFGSEIVDRETAEHRHILLSTALLPWMTGEMAQRVSGSADAGELLQGFCQRQLFTDSRPGKPAAYRYHDLFRAYLLARAEAAYTPGEWRRLQSTAAEVLKCNNEPEEAFALYVCTEDWDRAAELIVEHAARLLAQGRAEMLRRWIECLPDGLQGTPWLAYWHAVALMAVDRGEAHAALERAWKGFRDTSDETGQVLTAAAELEIFQYDSDSDAAARWFNVLGELLARNSPILNCDLLRASVALRRQDRATCHRLLRKVFVGASSTSAVPRTFVLYPALMSELCAEALRSQIAVEQVRALIKQYRLRPPSLDEEAWPWPIKIYTLGSFTVLKDEAAIGFSRKTQKRPLELLQALIALGGHDVSVATLTDCLWPDAEGDAGYHAFENALYRLRLLLGSPDALTLIAGKLSINRQYCWADLWAFERVVKAVSADAGGPDSALVRITQLYRGPFLAQVSEKSWALAARERLREKFLSCVQHAAQSYEARQRWEDAASLYERGIEFDNLAERLYRGLMVCHRALGNHAEGLRVYRRCRELLSVVLGVQPAAETQAVYQSLKRTSAQSAEPVCA